MILEQGYHPPADMRAVRLHNWKELRCVHGLVLSEMLFQVDHQLWSQVEAYGGI